MSECSVINFLKSIRVLLQRTNFRAFVTSLKPDESALVWSSLDLHWSYNSCIGFLKLPINFRHWNHGYKDRFSSTYVTNTLGLEIKEQHSYLNITNRKLIPIQNSLLSSMLLLATPGECMSVDVSPVNCSDSDSDTLI